MNVAIVLAGGKGRRMGSDIPKQYMDVAGKPLIYYSIKAFQDSSIIDRIVVVASEDYARYIKSCIVEEYGFDKVKDIVLGGIERYDSVYEGLKCIENYNSDKGGYVFIHDGARPCVSDAVLNDCMTAVKEFGACVAAVPVKDTIKIADSDLMAANTPDRSVLWQIQTPQVFEYSIVKNGYDRLFDDEDKSGITDDAMVVEKYMNVRVKLVCSDYRNIKVTTPEDLEIVRLFLAR